MNRIYQYPLPPPRPATNRLTHLFDVTSPRAATAAPQPVAPPEGWLAWIRRKLAEIAGDWRHEFHMLPSYEECLNDVHICWDCGKLREQCRCLPGEG